MGPHNHSISDGCEFYNSSNGQSIMDWCLFKSVSGKCEKPGDIL